MRHLGLDIGATGIRVVELEPKLHEGFFVLRKVGFEPLPPGSIIEGQIVDETTVASAVTTAIRNAKFPMVGFVAGVSHGAQAGLLDIPAGAKESEREHLIREAQLSMLSTFDDAYSLRLSWRLLDTYVDEENVKHERLAISAAHQDTVRTIEKTLDMAGVRPRAIDLTGAALIRSLVRLAPGERTIQTLVDIGAEKTLVTTRTGPVPRSVREIPRGGRHVTDELMRELGANPDLVEEQKRRMELPSVGDNAESFSSAPGMSSLEGRQVSTAEAALQNAVDRLVTEISETIDSDSSTFPQNPTQGVTLIGGGARLHGLREYLAARLMVPVFVGNPWIAPEFNRQTSFLEGDPEALSDLTVAAGLAAWGMSSKSWTDTL